MSNNKRASNEQEREETKIAKQVKGERAVMDEWLRKVNGKNNCLGSALRMKFDIGERCTIAGERLDDSNGDIVAKIAFHHEGLQVSLFNTITRVSVSIMLVGRVLVDGLVDSTNAFLAVTCPIFKGYQTGVPPAHFWSVARSRHVNAEGYWEFELQAQFMPDRVIRFAIPSFVSQDEWIESRTLEPPPFKSPASAPAPEPESEPAPVVEPVVVPDIKALLGGEELYGGDNADDYTMADFSFNPPIKVNGKEVCNLVVDLQAGTAEFCDMDGENFHGVLGPISVILDDKKAAEAKKASRELMAKHHAAAKAKTTARPLKGAKVSIKKSE